MDNAAIRRNFSKAYQDAGGVPSYWYFDAHEYAAELAQFYSLPIPTVAGVIAALSANQRWEVNQRATERILHRPYWDTVIPISGNIFKRRALQLIYNQPDTVDQALGYVGGFKTSNFLRNIALPSDRAAVTIDRHMIRVALDDHSITDTVVKRWMSARFRYDALADNLSEVARFYGVIPNTFQAAIWENVVNGGV